MATNDTTLDDAAAKPARIRTLNGDVQVHPLTQQIEYDRYKASKRARGISRSPLAGLRIARAIPGSSVAPSDDPLDT